MSIPWFGGDDAAIYDEVAFGPPPGVWVFQGKVDIDGAVEYKLDTKQAPGKDGAKHTYQGYLAAKVNVGIMLHDEASLRAFEAMLKVLRPLPGKTIPPPIEIHHPWLDAYGLNKFLIPKVPFPRTIAPQLFEVKFACIEWFAQVPDKSSKVGTVPRYATKNVFNDQTVVVTPAAHPRPSKGAQKPK